METHLVFFGAAVVVVRAHRGVEVAHRAQHLAVHDVFHDGFAGYADYRLKLRHLDELALAGPLPVVEGGQDGERPVQGAVDVGVGLLQTEYPFAVVANQAIHTSQSGEGRPVCLSIAERPAVAGGGQ